MTEGPIEGSKLQEKDLVDLKTKLKDFATLSPERQAVSLREISDLILDTVTDQLIAESLVDNQEIQQRLIKSAELAFKTPVKDLEEKDKHRNIWNSGYSVAIISNKGEVLGITYKETPILASYGYTGRYALLKALYEFHLNRAGKIGGLNNVKNFDYLTRICNLIPFEHVFMGSCDGPIDFGKGSTFIGGSGCEVKQDYLKQLLKIREDQEIGSETQAGRFDSVFCDTTAMYLRDPEVTEPVVIKPNILIRNLYFGN